MTDEIAQEREKILNEILQWSRGASQKLDYGYYDPTIFVFELESKIESMRKGAP